MRFLLGKVIDVMEARLGASMEYLRYVLRVSKRAFLAFLGTALLDSYRSRMPRAARHIARIVATQADDCGPCVQICVNMARAEVVPTSIIHDALHARLDRLRPISRTFIDTRLRYARGKVTWMKRVSGFGGSSATKESLTWLWPSLARAYSRSQSEPLGTRRTVPCRRRGLKRRVKCVSGVLANSVELPRVLTL